MTSKAVTERIAPNDNLTPPQAAELLQVPVTTLSVWRCTNRVILPYFKAGGHVRYRRQDIEHFIAQNMRNTELAAA
jgi:hypothetical protein